MTREEEERNVRTGFPPIEDSQSEDTVTGGERARTVGDIRAFLEDGVKSEAFLELRLEALRADHRQQIQQTELQHHASLESRILQNSLLSVDDVWRTGANGPLEGLLSGYDRKNPRTKDRAGFNRCEGPRRSSSTPDLTSKRHQQMPATATQPYNVTLWETPTKQPLFQTKTPKDAKRVTFDKEEKDMAGCQKQFCVAPIPGHVFLPLYDNITQERERERKEGHEKRRDFLLSMQRPFSFMKREEKRREMLLQEMGPVTQAEKSKSASVRKVIPKAVMNSGVTEHLKEEELCRKIHIQVRAQETLRSSSAPIQHQPPRAADVEARSAQRTKNKALAYLEQRPSFRPKTNAQVPDFDRLHQAFQREATRRAERRDVTQCQPFQLRTSTLPPRQSRGSLETPQESTDKTCLRRSNSFSGLTSLSMDTLPTYITDAARKRSMAIRRSMEQKECKEEESAAWMRRHTMKSQAMKKMVSVRAKAMDPHCSLKEVYQEKLKQHRQADQQRVREYKRELQEMKARVTARPYLFEQVSQKSAKSDAERRYRSTLEQAGLDEHFVKTAGGQAGVTPAFISDNDYDDDNDEDNDDDNQSIERDNQHREGSGKDGENNEEKKEESMKMDGEMQ